MIRGLRRRPPLSALDQVMSLPRQRLAPPPVEADGWVAVCPACAVRTVEVGTVEAAEYAGRMHDVAVHSGSWSARAVRVEDASRVVRMVTR